MRYIPKAFYPSLNSKPHGILYGRIAAGLLVALVLVHLFRIDTFLIILEDILPGGSATAKTATISILVIEIFAVPFALRMKLSYLGHILSGTFLLLVPFAWLALSIIYLGSAKQIGELGQFYPVYANFLTVIINSVWLLYNCLVLYSLRFDTFFRRS